MEALNGEWENIIDATLEMPDHGYLLWKNCTDIPFEKEKKIITGVHTMTSNDRSTEIEKGEEVQIYFR